MAAFDPPGRTARATGGRTTSRRLAALALAAGVAVALPPASGSAASAASLPQAPDDDLKKKYAKLKAESEKLSKEYRGELVTLEEAKKAAERAGADAARVDREYDEARAAVARLASTSYMTGRLDVIPIISSAEPGAAVHDAAVIEHISRNNDRRLENLQTLTAKAEQSKETAGKKLDAVEKEIKDLKSQRTRVKKLLAKYKPQVTRTQAPAGGGSGRPDGASGTKSPIVGNSMTARMRSVLVEIDGRFGAFPTIGCSRPGDPQDHGSGTACDFMESTGGSMPSASAQAHGDSVAQYLINNASRMGLKYIIWKQRIYDFRSSGGWRQMEDRGSITQNHYDHIHVSVL
ncbi:MULTISPECIES: coiled-coil domain-containing protein [unclassified Spirillospora]|uniref:coiled-coil domain-containing protein n=1 Tax=unclassified Spirillospora TaxID=2642701 RepID=UPI003718FC4A